MRLAIAEQQTDPSNRSLAQLRRYGAVPLAPQEITTPRAERVKSAVTWAAVAAACGIYLWQTDRPEWWVWPVMSFFALLGAASTYTIFRPIRLALDRDGFSFVGGVAAWRRQKKVYWRDVEKFVVMTTPGFRGRTNKYVAYKTEPNAKADWLKAAGQRMVGADAYIPMAWPKSHEAIVDDLNDYRRRALAEPGAISRS